MSQTTIEWTDATWNPVTGCTKVSQGCKNCYAERVFPRAYGALCVCGHKETFHGADLGDLAACGAIQCECKEFRRRQFTDVQCYPDRLEQPLHWRKPARVFVNSMSDLFHDDVEDAFISQVFAVMHLTPRHTYQILTKRPERMLSYLQEMSRDPEAYCYAWAHEMESFTCDATPALWPLPNVWLGVSVEDQKTADERIPLLLQTPAAKRFVSYEPALGAVDFRNFFSRRFLGLPDPLNGIDWLIVGGESGPGARPLQVDWVRSAIKQCRFAKVALFVKQFGAFAVERNDRVADVWYYADGSDMDTEELDGDSYRYQGAPVRLKLKDRKGGDPSEWPEDLRVREFPV